MCLFDWLFACVLVMFGWMCVGLLVCAFVCLVGCLLARAVGWLAACVFLCLVGCVLVRLVGWFVSCAHACSFVSLFGCACVHLFGTLFM